MNVLVWQWGRRGAGPLIGAGLARGFDALPEVRGLLSLPVQAEIMRGAAPLDCALPVETYQGMAGFLRRAATAPLAVAPLARRLRALGVDVAVCAMPGPLDLLMAAALRRNRTKFAVIVHDADAHPGDGLPFQMELQRRLVRQADAVVVLSAHVAARLRALGLPATKPVLRTTLPPFAFGGAVAPPGAHSGKLRLLSFGRLLPYKGLDLLAQALARAGDVDWEVRVVGSGPESAALERLRGLANVSVENRWVPEEEVGALLAWSDAIVLSHTEASQSGVAAAAIAARRWIVATDVGGLREQLQEDAMARLCAADAESLAAALRSLVSDPLPVTAADPARSWMQSAADLLPGLRALR